MPQKRPKPKLEPYEGPLTCLNVRRVADGKELCDQELVTVAYSRIRRSNDGMGLEANVLICPRCSVEADALSAFQAV